MTYALQAINLDKNFPKIKRYREFFTHPLKTCQIPVLKNINLEVNKGEIFGLLGPNGAGKTTLLKIFATLIWPSNGKAFVNGYETTKDEGNIKKTIGFVVNDERSFYWRLTGRQNLEFFAILNNIPKPQIERRIDELTRLVSLENNMDMVFQNYSSGMKQKLAIIRGMLADPHILIFDEPTRNLDPLVTSNLRTFIKKSIIGTMEKTVLIATNNMQEAEELCSRIAILHKGEIKLKGNVNEIRQFFNNKESLILELKGSFESIQKEIKGSTLPGQIVSLQAGIASPTISILKLEIDPDEDISGIIQTILNTGLLIQSFRREKLPLLDIFTRSVE